MMTADELKRAVGELSLYSAFAVGASNNSAAEAANAKMTAIMAAIDEMVAEVERLRQERDAWRQNAKEAQRALNDVLTAKAAAKAAETNDHA